MEIKLSGSNSPVDISSASGFTLHAPGMHGTIKEVDVTDETTRGPGAKDEMHKKIMDCLPSTEVLLFNQFEIEIQKDEYENADQSTTRAAGITRSTAAGEPAMVLNTPKNRKNMMCAVLHTDEHGESRWVFAAEENEDGFTFLLPRAGAALVAGVTGGVRGVVTKGIRRLVKVFAWITDELVGIGALALVTKWENKRRPYALNLIEPDNPTGLPMDWDKVANKPSLLLLHGTFSTWESAFEPLIKSDWMKKMHAHYEGRIFAFNHPSLHHFPAQNAQELLKMMPAGINLDLDIITHSRGGLVGRELIERLDQLDGNDWNIKVNKAIFVAGPHQGTILTDKDNWVKLIDTYTSLLTKLPDNTATIILESIMTFVKVIGGGAVKGLPGLQAMLPDGDYIKRLNASPANDTIYYTMGANYAPSDEKLLVRLGKQILMKILAKVFGENSDMVVPTLGSFGSDTKAGGFPVPAERQRKYELDADLHHLNYFTSEVLNKQLFQWLSV